MITKINFKTLEHFAGVRQLLFIHPLLCKTVRVFEVPEVHLETGKYNEIKEILDSTATRKVAGIWFYTPADRDMMIEALEHFTDTLDVDTLLVEETPKFGRDNLNQPIQTILN